MVYPHAKLRRVPCSLCIEADAQACGRTPFIFVTALHLALRRQRNFNMPAATAALDGCASCHGEPIHFVVTALAGGAAVFGTNRRALYYKNHSRQLPSGRLQILRAVDGHNHTETLEAYARPAPQSLLTVSHSSSFTR